MRSELQRGIRRSHVVDRPVHPFRGRITANDLYFSRAREFLLSCGIIKREAVSLPQRQDRPTNCHPDYLASTTSMLIAITTHWRCFLL